MIMEGMCPGTQLIGRAIRFSTVSFVTMAFSGIIRADLSSLIRETEDSILISGSLSNRKDEK